MHVSSRPGRTGVAQAAVFILLLAIYLATGAGRFRIIDEVSLFAVTESLAKRGALDTNAIAWTQWVNSPGEVLGAFGPQGDVFSKKGPAPAVLATPFYLLGWLSQRLPWPALHLSMLQTAFWFNAVLTALTAVILMRLVLALGYRLAAATVAGLAYGLGTLAWPYATHFFGEPLSGLALLSCVYALLRLRQTGRWRAAFAAGGAAGVLVATSAAHALLLLPLGVYLLVAVGAGAAQGWRRLLGRGLLFLLPLGAIVALVLAYNQTRFGTLLTTGYHFETGEGFTADWGVGLWGLLFSPYRGFFWYTPLALAGVIAWPGFIRRHRAEGGLVLALTLVLVALFGKWWMWWGGFAWGPRFLTPLAPFFVLTLAPWLEARPRGIRLSLAGVIVVSVGVQLLAVGANYVNFEIALRQRYATDWADPLRYGPPALFNPADSPIVGQAQLLWHDLGAHLAPGWWQAGRVRWEGLAAAGITAVLAASALWLLRRGRAGWSRGALWLAVPAVLATAFLSAKINAAQADYGSSPGYSAALAAVTQRGGPEDGLITVAPYHYQIPMASDAGQLPIYGYATEPTPLHPETEAVLARGLLRHPRLWLITVGLPPADPANGVEAWLAGQAFVAEDRWLADARLVSYLTAERLTPLAVTAQFGEQARLALARVNKTSLRGGEGLAIELNWEGLAQGGDWRGFVQLLDAEGRLVVGQDGALQAGYAAGGAVRDRRGLWLPADLPPGPYRLIAGLYSASTGERLPTYDAAGQALGDAATLGMITVR